MPLQPSDFQQRPQECTLRKGQSFKIPFYKIEFNQGHDLHKQNRIGNDSLFDTDKNTHYLFSVSLKAGKVWYL